MTGNYKHRSILVVHYRNYIIPHKMTINKKTRVVNTYRAMVKLGIAHRKKREERKIDCESD